MNRNPETEIVLKIKNNTNFTQPVELFSAIPNNNFANNSNALYTWNLSSENYSASSNVTILISNTSNPTPVYYSIPLSGNNIQSVVDALNTLNQGIFQYDGTTIYVSNNYYIYGALEVVSTIFTSVWNTNNTSVGSSASNQIFFPLNAGGFYNFVVDWGDGSQNTITAWNQPQLLHTYAIAGIYTIKITGTFNGGFQFNDYFDKKKLLSISNWGILKIIDGSNFIGCSNLNLSSVVGVLDLNEMTIMDFLFANCNSLTTINNINQWDVSNIVSMAGLFLNCTLFNDNISSWNISNVTSLNSAFELATSFNQPLNNWNVSNCQDFGNMFREASAFNQPLNNWNVSSALIMSGMFQLANAFNQNIGNWNIYQVFDFSNFMFGKTNLNYSATNLDAIYNGWSTLTLVIGINISFGSIKYTLAGQSGKNILLGAPNNWVITDGGI
jgi:surface protein